MTNTPSKSSNAKGQSKRRDAFHHGDLQKAAAEAAYGIVRNLGVRGLSLRGVAEQCGVDHRALYRHYKDKQALITAVVIRGFEELNSYLIEEKQVDTAHLLERYTEFAFHFPRLYDLMFSTEGRRLFKDPQIAAEIKKLTMHAALISAAEGGKVDDELRDRVVRGWALAHGLIDLWRRGALKASTPELAFEYIIKQLRISAPLL